MGIGSYAQIRGTGINANFVAPSSMRAVVDGASVNAAVSDVPHANVPHQAERESHQNRDAWLQILLVPQAGRRGMPWNWRSNATAAMRHVRHALACESTDLGALSNRSRAHLHHLGHCAHRVLRKLLCFGLWAP